MKNEQVEEFYEECSFDLVNLTNFGRNYRLDINEYIPKNINYMEVLDG